MSLLIIAVGVFLLFSLVARMFPTTAIAIVLVFGVLAYVTFGHHEISDGATKVYAWIIVAALVMDICMLAKPPAPRGSC